MQREIMLPQDVRIFERDPTWNALYYTRLYYQQGQVLTIGEPARMVYDHRDQYAVPVMERDGTIEHYLILEEIGLTELLPN